MTASGTNDDDCFYYICHAQARKEALSAKHRQMIDRLFNIWDNDGQGYVDNEEAENVLSKFVKISSSLLKLGAVFTIKGFLHSSLCMSSFYLTLFRFLSMNSKQTASLSWFKICDPGKRTFHTRVFKCFVERDGIAGSWWRRIFA